MKVWHFRKWYFEDLRFLKMTTWMSDISESEILVVWHFEILTFWKFDISESLFLENISTSNTTPTYDSYIWLLQMIPLYDLKLTIFSVHSRWPQLWSHGRIHSLRYCSPWLIPRQQLPRLHCFPFHWCCWKDSTKYNVCCSRCLLRSC